MNEYQAVARSVRENLDAHHGLGGHDPAMIQVLGTAEEAGEFVGAYRRWIGGARRSGTFEDVVAELADVVIVAHVAAEYLGINLAVAVAEKSAKIHTRGWREPVA